MRIYQFRIKEKEDTGKRDPLCTSQRGKTKQSTLFFFLDFFPNAQFDMQEKARLPHEKEGCGWIYGKMFVAPFFCLSLFLFLAPRTDRYGGRGKEGSDGCESQFFFLSLSVAKDGN